MIQDFQPALVEKNRQLIFHLLQSLHVNLTQI